MNGDETDKTKLSDDRSRIEADTAGMMPEQKARFERLLLTDEIDSEGRLHGRLRSDDVRYGRRRIRGASID